MMRWWGRAELLEAHLAFHQSKSRRRTACSSSMLALRTAEDDKKVARLRWHDENTVYVAWLAERAEREAGPRSARAPAR